MDPVSVFVVPVISALIAKIPDLIFGHLERRGALAARQQEEEARLAERLEDRRTAALRTFSREQDLQRFMRERQARYAAHYPLGVVGRIARGPQSFLPSVLVSPVPAGGRYAGNAIPALVHELIWNVPDARRYVDLHTGAFVSDHGVPRAIGGSLGAAEIGALEFSGRPAVIVYFESIGDKLVAFAYLNSLVPTADGSTGFALRVACFGRTPGLPAGLPGAGDLPTWQYVNLAALAQPDDQVIAAVVTWFVVTCLEIHWRLCGVTDIDLRSGMTISESPPGFGSRQVPRSVFASRMEREISQIAHAGYEVETAEFTDDRVALVIPIGDRQIAFVVTDAYPVEPPLVLTQSGRDRQRFELDGASWSPDRTLLEVLESLR
ncbi:hypothetical protein [Streptosporangium sp. KLBMP 9127]|nr:hypothetical protein [Streptosporangium sp. KLBMP 9127]